MLTDFTPGSRYSTRIDNARKVLREAEQLASDAQDQLDRLQDAELHFGFDDYEDGAILIWDQQFNEGGRTYQFAALKTAQGWHVTGNTQHPISWVRLTDMMVRGSNGKYPTIWLVETLTKVSE